MLPTKLRVIFDSTESHSSELKDMSNKLKASVEETAVFTNKVI